MFNPAATPYGGTRSFQRPAPGAIPDLGAGVNGTPDPQQQAPGTPTTTQQAPGTPTPPRTTNFSAGGAVGDDEISGVDNDPTNDLTSALDTVKSALTYGRQLHGLGGGDQAAAMPTIPGNPSESGIPRPRPGGPGTQTAAAMPTIPGTQSESGIPPQRPGGPGTQKISAAMPTIPGNPSESGIPRPRPGGPGTQTAAAMPMIPGTQSESGIPPQRPGGPGTQKLAENDDYPEDISEEDDANGAG